MTKARIYELAYENLLLQIDREMQRVVEAEKKGRTHRIADARLARYYVEIDELYKLMREAQTGDF